MRTLVITLHVIDENIEAPREEMSYSNPNKAFMAKNIVGLQ